MRLVTLALVVCTLAAGCVAEEQEWLVTGTFMEDASQPDIEDLRGRIEPHGGQMVVLESFPMQFRISAPSQETCEAVRAVLGSAGYVDFYGECTRGESTGEGDAPTGTTNSSGGPTGTNR